MATIERLLGKSNQTKQYNTVGDRLKDTYNQSSTDYYADRSPRSSVFDVREQISKETGIEPSYRPTYTPPVQEPFTRRTQDDSYINPTTRQGQAQLKAEQRKQERAVELPQIRQQEEQREKTLAGNTQRLQNLLKQAKEIEFSPEPSAKAQTALTEDILGTRSRITSAQPGFKTGVREAFGFEPTERYGAQQATPQRQETYEKAIDTARQQEGFTAGRVTGEIGKQALLYATIGKAIEGTALGAKLASKLGGGKLGTFAAKQGVDLLVDTVIQTPQEAIQSVKEGEILGQFAKNWGVNRLVDLGMNLAIGGSSEGFKYLKSLNNTGDPAVKEAIEQSVKQLSPEDSKIFRDTLNIDAGIPSMLKQDIPQMQAVKGSDVLTPPSIGPTRGTRPKDIIEESSNILKTQLDSYKPEITSEYVPATRGQGKRVKGMTTGAMGTGYGFAETTQYKPLLSQLGVNNQEIEVLTSSASTTNKADNYLKAREYGLNHNDSLKFSVATEMKANGSIDDATYKKVLEEQTQHFKPISQADEIKDIDNTFEMTFEKTFGTKPSVKEATDKMPIPDTPVKTKTMASKIDNMPEMDTFKMVIEDPKQLKNVFKSESNPMLDEIKANIESIVGQAPKENRVDLLRAEAIARRDAGTAVIDPVEYKNIIESPTTKIPADVSRSELADIINNSTAYKDVGVYERWTTDVNRQFKKVFGDSYEKVKKLVLDPFDASKKAKVEDEILYTNKLKKDIVDKFGINKKSKDSALIQQWGEKRISLEDLKKESPKKWQDIVEADKWFRQQYDEIIDAINVRRMEINKPPIEKLDNYYRHFKEMTDTFSGIKNVFESQKQISPKLEGLSEFTKPKEKWAGFKQHRTGAGKFDDDAVGGFLEYLPAATYAKHIDPEIGKFRELKKGLANSTEGTKNINNFIGFLDEFTNDLAGKTNKFDRAVQDLVGRKSMAIANLLNSRIKSNAVLGNVSSALAQIANIPQGIAHVKDPRHILGGLQGLYRSIGGGGDKALYDQSGFLKERMTDVYSQFNTRMIDQPKRLAQWLLGVGDDAGTKFIWSAEYRKALAEGVDNPIKRADDITRSLVGGRGIGESPILQKSKLFQLVAPFTLEVNNLWKVQKDFMKEKDFAALAILYTTNFFLNNAMESVRGSRVTFDPIDAVIQGANESDTFADALVNIPGRLGGEILGNLPTGQAAAQLISEYPTKTDIPVPSFLPSTLRTEEGTLRIPSREDIFGETDPTRFGTGTPLTDAFKDPQKFASSLITPFGGQQLRKTLQGGQSLGIIPRMKDILKQQESIPVAETKSGRAVAGINVTPQTTAQALLFGKSAIPEVRDYYESGRSPFGTNQTKAYEELVRSGNYNAKDLFNALNEARAAKKKNERIAILNKYYTPEQVREIYTKFYPKPKK